MGYPEGRILKSIREVHIRMGVHFLLSRPRGAGE